jgi:transposase-like protein
MKDSPQPTNHRRYKFTFRAEVLPLASESRSTQAAARALHINAKLLYKWQKKLLPSSQRPTTYEPLLLYQSAVEAVPGALSPSSSCSS